MDLILTDPPYGIDLTPQRKNGKFYNSKIINDDNLNFLPKLVNECHRVSKGVVCIFCGWQTIDVFKKEFERKFNVKNILIWDKGWFGLGYNYRPIYEMCLLCTVNKNIIIKSKNKSNILRYKRLSSNAMIHPCEKPVSLLQDLIFELSDENDTVLDCFMGSGSTGVACCTTNRNFIGIEKDDKYFEVAKKRIEEANTTIFDL